MKYVCVDHLDNSIVTKTRAQDLIHLRLPLINSIIFKDINKTTLHVCIDKGQQANDCSKI